MYSTLLDALGFTIVAVVLFGFAVWLGVFFFFELGARLIRGPLAQERSLIDFEATRPIRPAGTDSETEALIHGGKGIHDYGKGIHDYHVIEDNEQRVVEHRHGNVIHRHRIRKLKKSA